MLAELFRSTLLRWTLYPGGEVAGFDGGQPSGFDWEASSCVEIADEGSNAGEVMGVDGSRDYRGGGVEGGDGVVFGLEREAPQLGTGGVSPSFK